MISKYLHNDVHTLINLMGQELVLLLQLQKKILHVETNIHLINLKICPIKWEASSHCCSAWYLLKFDRRMNTFSFIDVIIPNTQKLGLKETCQKRSSDFLSLHFSYTVATKAC